MVDVEARGESPEEMALSFGLGNLGGTRWEKDEKLDLIVKVINSGAFKYLSFEENLEIDKAIVSNTKVLEKKLYGNDEKHTTVVDLEYGRLDDLNPNQVYYFIKDGLHLDRFLTKRHEEEAFKKLYAEEKYRSLGIDKGVFCLQHNTVLRAKVYGYFIGEELSYLLAVRSNELLMGMLTEGLPYNTKNKLYGAYLVECYIPYANTIRRVNKISTRDIQRRDIFSEFEEGKISDRGKVTLPVIKPTLKTRVRKAFESFF